MNRHIQTSVYLFSAKADFKICIKKIYLILKIHLIFQAIRCVVGIRRSTQGNTEFSQRLRGKCLLPKIQDSKDKITKNLLNSYSSWQIKETLSVLELFSIIEILATQITALALIDKSLIKIQFLEKFHKVALVLKERSQREKRYGVIHKLRNRGQGGRAKITCQNSIN